MSGLRLRPILIVSAVGMVVHLAIMDVFLGGPIFHPYAWMSLLTGIGCGLAVAAKQTYTMRRQTRVHGSRPSS
jgi:hypothetical protein